MDLSTSEDLKKLVEELVTSGKGYLETGLIKRLKSICKKSDEALQHAAELVFEHLEERHAEVRFSCLQICHELFMRAHLFRTMLLDRIDQFMIKTMGTDKRKPLPPPKKVAENLKDLALKCFEQWHNQFGSAYTKLNMTHDYLVSVKKVNFAQVIANYDARNPAGDSKKDIVRKLKTEIDSAVQDAQAHEKEMMHLYELLTSQMLFTAEDFKNQESERSSNLDNDELRVLGIPSKGYSLELDLDKICTIKIERSDDNACMLDNLSDAVKSCERSFIPKLGTLLSRAEEFEAPATIISKLKKALSKLEGHLRRHKKLNIVVANDESDGDIDEFEEVNDVPLLTSLKPEKDIDESFHKTPKPKVEEAEMPGSSKTEKKELSKSIYERAPVVSYGNDLLFWDKEKLDEYKKISTFGAAKQFDVDHRFLNGSSAAATDSGMSDAAFSMLTSREIEVGGDLAPITHTCRARLPSGKLCPRQDRHKCPFHGPIVPRDSVGIPLFDEDKKREPKPKMAQDVDFLMDVVKQSDGNFRLVPKQEAKSKLRKETASKKSQGSSRGGLTDLNSNKPTTSRKRLMKKVLTKSSLKRVASSLDRIDDNLRSAKFKNNFNYALQ